MTTLAESREAGAALSVRLDALAALARLGQGRLDQDVLDDADAVLARTGERMRLSGEHTVVAFAGATGSGKSTLFNTIAGIDLSPVGVRRPTTGAAHACVWGLDGSGPLLEWLDIEKRHRYARASALDGDAGSSLHGLVLLDLPDHDSTAQRHRLEVDRLVAVADLIIWVVDPQKYADAAVHERYLRPGADYEPVTTVVLNQVDMLSAEEAAECAEDLRQLLVADGFSAPRVLATSAKSGAGMEELRSMIRERLSDRRVIAQRLSADLDRLSRRFVDHVGPEAVAFEPARRSAVVARLDEAAGVPAAASAMEHDHWYRGLRFVDWPFARFARGLRSDPFQRVRLGQETAEEVRTSSSVAAPAQPSMVRGAVWDLTAALTEDLPRPWASAVREAGRSRADEIPDALGAELGGIIPEQTRRPSWWWMVGALQWALVAAALCGFAWMTCIFAFGLLRASAAVPRFLSDPGLLPYTLALFGGALVGGVITAVLACRLLARGASGRRHAVRDRMMRRVEKVAEGFVFTPVQDELDRYARFAKAVGRLYPEKPAGHD